MNVNRKNDSMKKILVWGLLAVLGMACYDDLGNYDYNDINDMVLEMPRSVSVTIPKKDSVLVEVKAAVTQLDRKDNANLTDRKSTRLNSSHSGQSRMPSSA